MNRMTESIVAAAILAMLGWIAADLRSFRSQNPADLAEVRGGIADLRERMARLEGLFEGFTKRETAR